MKNAAILSAVLAIIPGAAVAGHEDTVKYARVTAVTPVYERVARTTPHEECWTETVRYEERAPCSSSATGTILGTMIGAAVGHNVARSKDGQKIGRIAGAVLGASIGHDVSRSRRNHPARVSYRDEPRCEMRRSTRYENVLVGYDVAYQYHGRTYHTRMDEHPGRRIPVAVDVRPLY